MAEPAAEGAVSCTRCVAASGCGTARIVQLEGLAYDAWEGRALVCPMDCCRGGAATMAGASLVQAASIAWDRTGAFERCLEARMDAWINARAALIVNEDPSGQRCRRSRRGAVGGHGPAGLRAAGRTRQPDIRGPLLAAHGALARAHSQRCASRCVTGPGRTKPPPLQHGEIELAPAGICRRVSARRAVTAPPRHGNLTIRRTGERIRAPIFALGWAEVPLG